MKEAQPPTVSGRRSSAVVRPAVGARRSSVALEDDLSAGTVLDTACVAGLLKVGRAAVSSVLQKTENKKVP